MRVLHNDSRQRDSFVTDHSPDSTRALSLIDAIKRLHKLALFFAFLASMSDIQS
jgi:hypothetical protein